MPVIFFLTCLVLFPPIFIIGCWFVLWLVVFLGEVTDVGISTFKAVCVPLRRRHPAKKPVESGN